MTHVEFANVVVHLYNIEESLIMEPKSTPFSTPTSAILNSSVLMHNN